MRRVVILDMSQKFRLFKAEMGQHENPEICFVGLDVDGIYNALYSFQNVIFSIFFISTKNFSDYLVTGNLATNQSKQTLEPSCYVLMTHFLTEF